MNSIKHLKRLTLLVLGICSISANLFGSIWRVNNNPVYVGGSSNTCKHCFTDLQTAINSSKLSPGDTIHLEASAVNYGNVSINRKLVILGTGHLLADNHITSAVGRVDIKAGADGLVMEGISVAGGSSDDISFSSTNLKNISIRKCYIGGGVYFSTHPNNSYSNISIEKCIILGSISYSSSDGPFTGLNISNNYIGNGIYLRSQYKGTFKHNLIGEGRFVVFSGVNCYNNIILGSSTRFDQNNNDSSNIYHNIFIIARPAWLVGGNNEFGMSASNVLPISATKFEDRLKPYSSCVECFKGYKPGSNNAQIGLYGGSDPYVRSALPAIPSIYKLRGSTTTFRGDSTIVEISTKSNE